VDLTRFVVARGSADARFSHAAFARVVAASVELLDRVLDVTHWPLAQQAAQAQGKRRIALGFFGLAECMAALGLHPGSAQSLEFARAVARTLRDAAYRASVHLAARLGAFPLFDADAYLDPRTFAATLPEDIRSAIRQHGIRNSHVLWLPPGGSEWMDAAGDDKLAPHERLAIAAAVAPFIDGGVGAAIALPAGDDFLALGEAWLQAWRLGLQACRVA
jgi:ribonucleoside-diphosphate reductase alpha chain